MAISFPASPSQDDVYTYNGVKYVFDGTKWVSGGSTPSFVLKSGDTVNGDLAIDEKLFVGTASSYGLTTNAVVAGSAAEGVVSIINDGDTFINTNDSLGTINFGAHESGGTAYVGASISAQADAAWTSGAPGRLRFATTSDGESSPTERLKIDDAGYLRLSADSPGIQFGGDTAAANALDDYEEGTWTPTLVTGTGAFDATSWGRYTRIGNRVWVQTYTRVSSIDDQSENFAVGGLPFTPMDPGTGGFTGTVMAQNSTWGDTTKTQLVVYVTDTTGGIRFYGMQNNASWTSIHNIDVAAADSFYITLTYEV